MKKLFLYFALFSFLLICTACPPPTFDCVIENKSDYPAELFLLYHKKATNTNNNTIVLKANEKTTVAFYYESDNVRLTSKNYNVLKKLSAREYVIENLEPTKYNIHNFLPISITLLDNGMNILADSTTKRITDKISAPTGNSECYFFRGIKSDDVVLQPIGETLIGTFKYSIEKIANYYFLQIEKNSQSVEKHKIDIDVSSNDIVISY
jgi:hypothetical protein